MTINNISINTLHSDSFTVSFSNFPSLSATQDLVIFDRFVKSIVIPDYSVSEMYSDFQAYRIRHPVGTKINENLSQIQIEFKVDESLSNYLAVYEYMRQIRYGELDLDASDDDRIRKYVIKAIMLNILDNQKRLIARMRFTNAFITNLSSLPLTTGTAEELTFTIQCSYSELLYERVSVFS